MEEEVVGGWGRFWDLGCFGWYVGLGLGFVKDGIGW